MAEQVKKPANSVKSMKTSIIGWVKTDPELTTVSIAGENVSVLEFAFIRKGVFINCRMWRKMAERHAAFLKKGRLIQVDCTTEPEAYMATINGGPAQKEAWKFRVTDIVYLDDPTASEASSVDAIPVEIADDDQVF